MGHLRERRGGHQIFYFNNVIIKKERDRKPVLFSKEKSKQLVELGDFIN